MWFKTSLFVKPAQDPDFPRVVAAAIMRKRPSGNVAQLADAGDVMGPSGNVAQLADAGDVMEYSTWTSTKEADDLMDSIRALGYVPKEHGADAPLALSVRRVRKKGHFSMLQIEEMRVLNAQHTEQKIAQSRQLALWMRFVLLATYRNSMASTTPSAKVQQGQEERLAYFRANARN